VFSVKLELKFYIYMCYVCYNKQYFINVNRFDLIDLSL
jgi:hypothetical protein